MRRPAFRDISESYELSYELGVRYLPYSELESNRESMARFGEGLKAICAISHSIA